jgi:hypothetical protein
MATYYVRPDGNDGNAGTGSSTAQAWATIVKALGATGITGGDTVYIAPGRYAAQIVIGGTYSSATNIIGDPLCTQFSGLTAGKVFITNVASSGASVFSGVLVNGSAKSNLAFSGIAFENTSNSTLARCVDLLLGQNNSFTKCTFRQTGYGAPLINMSAPASLALNATIDRCVMGGGQVNYSGTPMVGLSGNNVSDATTVKNCLFYSGTLGALLYLVSVSVSVFNCTFINQPVTAIQSASGSLTYPTYVRNCLFVGINSAMNSSVTGHIVQEYNRLMNSSMFQVATSVTSSNSYDAGIEDGYSLINGLNTSAIYATQLGGANTSFGTASGAPTTDIYGFPWSGTSPDAGASTYKTLATINPVYNPTERNASAITIAPASTSQSIELYLGATGLTFATSGLAAYYVRNQSAPVAITLVTQTATGAWSSGGFAEIDSSLVPGVYRLDVPNAAFAAGASDVTIVVRGASGTNGAVLTVTLSSGGLTAAQTASAVFDAVSSSYTTAGSMGARLLKTTVDNRPVDVGSSQHIQANIHAIVDSTAAATELSGALLHNGTDYISADLLTPVSAATSVHIGPYQLLADGLGADQPLDVNVGTATSIDVQVTDANGTGIDITGATVTAKVYSSTGTLVASYAGTATYADNGRLSFGLTTTVTNTSGTYTVTVTRTTGATDTQIFGPLRLYVRPA